MSNTQEAPTNGNGKHDTSPTRNYNPDEPGVRNFGGEWDSESIGLMRQTLNSYSNRMDYFNRLLGDPRRNLDIECGYPSTYAVGADYYRQLYDRDPIASRVVQLMPKECWQKTPRIYEDEDSKNATEFEDAWDNLGQQLSPEKSWYEDEEGSLVWEYLRRADEISGIGAFGVMLLGLDDGKDLREPVEGAISDKYVRDRDGTAEKKTVTSNGARVEVAQINPRMLSFPTPMPDETVLNEMVTNAATPSMEKWKEGGSVGNKHVDQTEAKKFGVDPRFVKNSEGTTLHLLRNGEIVTNQYLSEIGVTENVTTPKDLIGGQDSQYFNQFSSAKGGNDAQYVGVQLGQSQFPVEKALKTKLNLTFLRVFDESLVQIVQYEANIRNPRFGRPVMYRITFSDPREQHSGIGMPLASIYVHWTRVVHLADTGNGVSSEIFAAPRMRPVLNPLLDCRKISGAGAEGYWQSCFAGIVLSTHPQLGGEVQLDVPANKAMMENYFNGLQRFLILSGMGASTIAPSVVDPTPHADLQVKRICIQIGCPKRVFEGSERGELASSQDDSKWNDRIGSRCNCYVTPRIICPFVDRLILLGVLPEPEKYRIEWPDLDSTTKKDKATIAGTVTTALQAYVGGNVESVVAPLDYLTRVLDFDEEEADEIIKGTTKAHENEMTMTMPPMGQPGHPATVPPPQPKVTPGPTILGPGQTAIPHPDAGGGKPFTAPGKPAPGVQVAAAPAGPPQATPAKPPTKNEASKFSRPENYDKIKDLGKGLELWVGGNDWENGWNRAWIQTAGEQQVPMKPVSWMDTNHADCPGCEDSTGCYGNWRKCVEHSKPQVFAWANELRKSIRAVTKNENPNHDEQGRFAPADGGGSDVKTGERVHRDAAGNKFNPDNGLLPHEEEALKEMAKISPGRTHKLAEERQIEQQGKARLATVDRSVNEPWKASKFEPSNKKFSDKSDKHLRKSLGMSKKEWKQFKSDSAPGSKQSDLLPFMMRHNAELDNVVLGYLLTTNKDGWVTLPSGAHIQLKDGEIVKGPKIDKKEGGDTKARDDAKAHLAKIMKEKGIKHEEDKGDVGDDHRGAGGYEKGSVHEKAYKAGEAFRGAAKTGGKIAGEALGALGKKVAGSQIGQRVKDEFREAGSVVREAAGKVGGFFKSLRKHLSLNKQEWRAFKQTPTFNILLLADHLARNGRPTDEPAPRSTLLLNTQLGIRDLMVKDMVDNGMELVFNEAGPDESDMISSALAAHPDDEWFEMLLQTAVQETQGDVAKAVKFAEEYYEMNPDGGGDEDDDEEEDDDFEDRDDEGDLIDNANPQGCNQYKECGGEGSSKDTAKQISEHFGHLLSGGQTDKKAFVWKVEQEDKLIHVQPIEGNDSHTTHSRVAATREAATAFEKANPDWNVIVRDPKATHNSNPQGINQYSAVGASASHREAYQHPFMYEKATNESHAFLSQVGESAESKSSAPLKPVKLSTLVATQQSVVPAIVQKFRESAPPGHPTILEHQGAQYIIDGHHRAAAAFDRGDKTIEAHHWTMSRDGKITPTVRGGDA